MPVAPSAASAVKQHPELPCEKTLRQSNTKIHKPSPACSRFSCFSFLFTLFKHVSRFSFSEIFCSFRTKSLKDLPRHSAMSTARNVYVKWKLCKQLHQLQTITIKKTRTSKSIDFDSVELLHTLPMARPSFCFKMARR